MKRSIAVCVVLLGAVLARCGTAEAHAFLDHADPKVGATIAAAPAALKLFFTEDVEPAFSKVEVADGDGKAVAVGALEHPSEAAIRVSLPGLAAGTYRVRWKVISVDTHETDGSFEFSITAP